MAVTEIPLTTGSGTTDSTTFTTASITPTPGRLIFATVYVTLASGTSTATATGNGLNWVKVDQTSAAGRTMYIFRARGPAPTAGPVTFTSSATASSVLWQVVEFNGADTSGTDGSGAIVQTVNARPGSSSTVNLPFPAAVDPANATYAAIGNNGTTPTVGGAPWTTVAGTSGTSPTSGFLGEFAATAAQNVTASFPTASSVHVVGVEIKAAAAGATPTGSATGSLGFTGAAVGAATYRGTATGTWTFTGVARGANTPVGRAAGTWTFTGAAVGVSDRNGTAAGSWGFTGAAAGTIPKTGSASGAWGFTGSAVGRTPVVVGISHTYGYATLVSSGITTAALVTVPPGIATLVGTPVTTASLGGFGKDFGLNFGAVTVTEAAAFGAADGTSSAVLTDTTGRATLQT